LRRVWDAFQIDRRDEEAQNRLNLARSVTEKYPPALALIKGLLPACSSFPRWPVRPPLLATPDETIRKAMAELGW
jgi:hypothetical protein